MPANSYIATTVLPSYWGWTAYTPVIPKLYWDVYSQEERIKRLCIENDKIIHYIDMVVQHINENDSNFQEQIDNILDSVTQQLEEQNALITEQLEAQNLRIQQQFATQQAWVTEQNNKLRQYVDQKLQEFSESSTIWDVTSGQYLPSQQAMRRLMQVLTYNNTGDRQLVSTMAEKPVSELAESTIYYNNFSERENVVMNDQNHSVYEED